MNVRSALLVIHLTLVLIGLAYFVLAITVGSTPDANIGAGLAALWLVALGSPWGWAALIPGIHGTWFILIAVSSAMVNLGIHGLLALRRRTRLEERAAAVS